MRQKPSWSIGLALAAFLSLSGSVQAVIGYVNVVYTNGFSFTVNPLDTTNNSINYILSAGVPPVGSRVYLWDVTNQVFLPPSIRSAAPPSWSVNYDLSPGKGFVLFVPVKWTNTYVGEVLQGSLTNFVAGSNKLSLLGSKVPQSGELSSGLQFPGIDGDQVYLFRTESQSFSDGYCYFSPYGWFDPKGVATAGGPVCNIAESFFVRNPGPDTNWVRSFIINFAGPPSRSLAGGNSSTPEITGFGITGGQIRLTVRSPGGAPYDVQFSANGLDWTTVAVHQVADIWARKLPEDASGYFRVVASKPESGTP